MGGRSTRPLDRSVGPLPAAVCAHANPGVPYGHGHLTSDDSPDIMGGTPVFTGTRVPVHSLLEFLEAGDTIDDFLAAFPSVKRVQVVEFLEKAADLAVTAAA